MKTNEIPPYDKNDNPTGCCPRFHPEPWDAQELYFDDKPFVRASTVSLFHIPLNMTSVFSKTWAKIEDANAVGDSFLVLSHDDSPWHAEHLFAVDKDVPGAEIVRLTGTYLTKVFEGPFSQIRQWCKDMQALVERTGKKIEKQYYFYTTCPRCAKVYGKNFVVGIAQVS